MIQPPKMSPWKFASAGIGMTRNAGMPGGSCHVALRRIAVSRVVRTRRRRASSRSSRRRILPTLDFGSSLRNSTSRGHL